MRCLACRQIWLPLLVNTPGTQACTCCVHNNSNAFGSSNECVPLKTNTMDRMLIEMQGNLEYVSVSSMYRTYTLPSRTGAQWGWGALEARQMCSLPTSYCYCYFQWHHHHIRYSNSIFDIFDVRYSKFLSYTKIVPVARSTC